MDSLAQDIFEDWVHGPQKDKDIIETTRGLKWKFPVIYVLYHTVVKPIIKNTMVFIDFKIQDYIYYSIPSN